MTESQGRIAPPHNLPVQPTSFIGREWELAEVRRLLHTTRLLTLTGAGGAGKTRLALELASQVSSEFPDGVWLVELAPLSDPELLAQTVASALYVLDSPIQSAGETISNALSGRQLLLLIDNCEHLADASGRLLDALLRTCPTLRLLTTSREPLNIAGEVAWFVPSLRLPAAGETHEKLLDYDSVRLFVERAQAALPGFELDANNSAFVSVICRQLDGIPLALELAAARVRALTVQQIATRLEDRFRLLTTGVRTAAPRHQTLRALVDWSHDLLSALECVLFRRLSVFAGGWTLEAAESICAGQGLASEDILDLLSRLVDKSLVQPRQQFGAERYGLYETLRQYAADKLETSGEGAEVRRRHLAWYRELAEGTDGGYKGPELATRLQVLDTELGNVRAALQYALQDSTALEDGLRLVGALWQFWWLAGHGAEGEQFLSALLARASDSQQGQGESHAETSVYVWAGTVAGFLATRRHRPDVARPLLEEALAAWRELGDAENVAWCLRDLGNVAAQEGQLERARTQLEESLSLAREVGVRPRVYESLANLGRVLKTLGALDRAESLLQESLALGEEQGDHRHQGLSAFYLGCVELDRGNTNEARERLLQALRMFRRAGVRASLASALELLAGLAVNTQPARALRLAGAAATARNAFGEESERDPIWNAKAVERVNRLREQLGKAGELAWAEGEAMTAEEAVAYALSEEEGLSPGTAGSRPASIATAVVLTPREREVAVLVSRGYSNPDIASTLVIARATAKRHVENILTKLALNSRAELAGWTTSQPWFSEFGPRSP